MNPDSANSAADRWRRRDQILAALLACPPEQQAALLAKHCDGDEALRQEVATLLAAQQKVRSVIESPPAATTTPLEPEMAHILFMDLVGYSKLPTDEQVQRQQTLHQLVQQTKEFRRAQQQDQLISLPTGDGMALVFFRDPVAPVQCAIELAQFVRRQPEIALRMGVHSGLVYRVADINANRNVAGGGINIAQRVMDCGDAGHILVSSTVAGVLGEAGHWSDYLTDWGEQEVKHGARLHLYNLYTGEVGNQSLPARLRRTMPLTEPLPNTPSVIKAETIPPQKLLIKWLVAGTVLVVLCGVLIWVWQRPAASPQANQTNIVAANAATVPQTMLSYSLRTRPNPAKYPNAKEESLPGEIIFTPGDEMRVSFVSAEDGYFYLLNEGPQPVNGLPRYNLLFPALQPGSTASPTLRAQQPLHIPQERPPWFRVDAEQGTETLWLIWSARSISELEAVRKWLNAKDGGEIKDANETKLVQGFLRQHYAAAKPIAEKDEQQTNLKGDNDGLLIYAMKLAHR